MRFLKLLLIEYITAGGLNNVLLTSSLLREAMLMRDALLHDFSLLKDVEIITTYDARLSSSTKTQQAIRIDEKSNAMEIWQSLLQGCDAALLIGPETDGILRELTKIIALSSAKNLGCNQPAVNVASSKYATFQALKTANILTISTHAASTYITSSLNADESISNGYVVKPDDGAGCDDTFYFQNKGMLREWLNLNVDKLARYIVQPYQTGMAASISVLCKDGEAWVLSGNQQKVAIKSNQSSQAEVFQYHGSVVNALTHYNAAFVRLADRIAKAIPGLNGYIGIDVIIDDEAIYVVEINPRITTSYIALHESLACNPAELLLDLVDNPNFELPENLANKMVEVSFNE